MSQANARIQQNSGALASLGFRLVADPDAGLRQGAPHSGSPGPQQQGIGTGRCARTRRGTGARREYGQVLRFVPAPGSGKRETTDSDLCIPKGLSAKETERYLRENASKICGCRRQAHASRDSNNPQEWRLKRHPAQIGGPLPILIHNARRYTCHRAVRALPRRWQAPTVFNMGIFRPFRVGPRNGQSICRASPGKSHPPPL
jgi:hypothetical protein